jgi:16S rRNA (guanine966-N2)-methyltransferase
MATAPRPPPRGGGTNQLRIIGGRYRGRRLQFPSLPGLRPTGDRVRETLFNWLQPLIQGARCLDLFAGSGALGLEAASRGAGRVVLVERARPAAEQLRAHVRTLGLEGVEVIEADALQWLAGPAQPFDILFLDPPFAAQLLEPVCRLLTGNNWLSPTARIYLEADAASYLALLPPGLELIKDQRAGQVRFGLARKTGG